MVANVTPATFLALQMHAKPGMFAVLLGSGVSRAAQIPTGWDVVTDLVRQVAAAAGDETELPRADPEEWWRDRVGTDLGYSTLLERAAPTQAARAALISRYFEPTDEQRDRGELQPTAAHRAIAELVRDGYVRVILTTNFDTLMEQALDAAGVQAQVISHAGMVAGMDSLHLRPTVVKLHGDYRQVTTLNTAAELDSYPGEWSALLGQILTDYGLIISGWSAAWDGALRECIQSTPTRRYPLYWDARSSRGEQAQSLLSGRGGESIDATDADALFRELLGSVRNLERSTALTPLDTTLAVAASKRHLATPASRIDLADVLELVSEPTRRAARDHSVADVDERMATTTAASDALMQVLASCIRFGQGWEVPLLVSAVRDLLTPEQPVVNLRQSLQSYGALLATYAMGLAERRFGDRGVLLEVLTADSDLRIDYGEVRAAIATHVNLHTLLPLDPQEVQSFHRFAGGPRWLMPKPELVAQDLRDFGRHIGFVGDDVFAEAFDDVEYRVGLVNLLGGGGLVHVPRRATGRWMLEHNWLPDPEGELRPRADLRFRALAERGHSPWVDYVVRQAGDLEVGLAKMHARAAAVRDRHFA